MKGAFEGVVAVHTMTNGLVAAVFTTGVLKVVRMSDFECILERDLLVETNDCTRIFEARLCSKTCISVVNQESIDKTIRLCVAYGAEAGREFGK